MEAPRPSVSKLKLQQQAFFEEVKAAGVHQAPHVKRWGRPTPKLYYDVSVGSPNGYVSITANWENRYVGVEFLVKNKQTYFFLKDHSAAIEEALGLTCDWQDLPERARSKILAKKYGDFLDEQERAELRSWAVATADRFAAVFPRYLENEALTVHPPDSTGAQRRAPDSANNTGLTNESGDSRTRDQDRRRSRAESTAHPLAQASPPSPEAGSKDVPPGDWRLGSTSVEATAGGPSLEDFAALVPRALWSRSGSVFYSGREAFSGPASMYLLGLNPGGDPQRRDGITIRSDTEWVVNSAPPNWSRYRDESWMGAAPGTWGMQPGVLHLLHRLSVDPGRVPASNLVFPRSRVETGIAGELDALAEACWPFHSAVIDRLKVRTIICFGANAAAVVRRRLGALDEIDQFVETNDRGWVSRTFESPDGIRVVKVTHPSRADWRNPAADPTDLVRAALAR